MTEPTEAAKQKACELANDEIAKGYERLERVRENGFWTIQDLCAGCEPNEVMALARVLQEHSDVAKAICDPNYVHGTMSSEFRQGAEWMQDKARYDLSGLILPDEIDPLVAALNEAYDATLRLDDTRSHREKFAECVRVSMDKRGLKIVEAGDD